jgi:biopolymer transport protein TolR
VEMPGADDMNETDKINIVPLADVTLVLLIIMMVLSPMVMSSMIRVMTPNVSKAAAKKTPDKAPDPLLIKVTGKGLFLNNNPVDSEEFLGEQIGIKLRAEPDRQVIVSADDNVEVGSVVSVLDIAKQRGAEKVSLVKGAPAP